MDAMKQVGTGFRMVYTGLLLIVLAVVINVIGTCVLRGQGPGAGGASQLMDLVVRGLSLAGSVVGLIGRFKCLAVPTASGAAKPLISVSVGLEVIGMLLSILILINNFVVNFLPLMVVISGLLVALVFSVTSTILFLLFTKTCAEYVRRRDLGGTAMSVLWLWVATVVCLVLAIVVPLLGAQAGGLDGAAAGGVGAIALGLSALVIGIIALIRYANLLLAMQTACNKFSYNSSYDDDEDDDDYDDRPRKRRRDDDDDDDDR